MHKRIKDEAVELLFKIKQKSVLLDFYSSTFIILKRINRLKSYKRRKTGRKIITK